jgi:hypothetical protein
VPEPPTLALLAAAAVALLAFSPFHRFLSQEHIMSRISTTLLPVMVLLGLCMFLGADSATDKSSVKPLAQFLFNGNANDETKTNPAFELKNTEFKDNALYLNGEYEFDSSTKDPYHAVCKTPKVNYKEFSVVLRFKAEDFSGNKTNLLTGGTSYRWFGMSRSSAGDLTITLNNQSFSREIKDAAIEKGKWTTVACGVDIPARKILVYINGKKAANIELPKDFKLEVIDSQAKDADKVWSFSNYSFGSVFHGLVDSLVIYGKLLSPEELAQLSQSRGEKSE